MSVVYLCSSPSVLDPERDPSEINVLVRECAATATEDLPRKYRLKFAPKADDWEPGGYFDPKREKPRHRRVGWFAVPQEAPEWLDQVFLPHTVVLEDALAGGGA